MTASTLVIGNRWAIIRLAEIQLQFSAYVPGSNETSEDESISFLVAAHYTASQVLDIHTLHSGRDSCAHTGSTTAINLLTLFPT